MVDVEQDHVVPLRDLGAEPARPHSSEEVAVQEPGPRVLGQADRVRQQLTLVPVDDLGDGVDDGQRPHPGVVESGVSGVAEPEATDEYVEVAAVGLRQAQPGELDLGDGEQAGHEVLVPELDLVHVDLQRRLHASAQADLAHRRLAPVELLEPLAHLALPFFSVRRRGGR